MEIKIARILLSCGVCVFFFKKTATLHKIMPDLSFSRFIIDHHILSHKKTTFIMGLETKKPGEPWDFFLPEKSRVFVHGF